MPDDKEALRQNGGTWNRGDWKGKGSSQWRISRDAVDMMNDAITDAINAVVKPDDTLWVLGDFAFVYKKDDYYRVCKFYRDRIRCQDVNLVWGNHDHRNIHDLFNKCYDLAMIRVGYTDLTLCHYAMAAWDQSHRGAIHLYGHSHGTAEKTLDQIMPGRRSMDVGVDNAALILGEYRPFSMDEVLNLLTPKEGFSVTPGANNLKGPREETLS